MSPPSGRPADHIDSPAGSAENLRLIVDDLRALASDVQAGEPQPESITLRVRFSRFLKRRLYLLLWWQNRQINTAVNLLSRWTSEERLVIERILESIQHIEARRSSDKSRLTEKADLIAQQLRAESSQIGHLTARLSQLDLKLEAETVHTQELATRLTDVAEKIEAENRGLTARLSNLTQKLEADSQGLAARLVDLAQKLEADSQQLAVRLSSLGLLTHQNRESLNIQDRRLSAFIDEARKRLPEPLGRESLDRIVNDQIQHRYDSLYAAFEDVFRGSREEIKTRQTVYLPLLEEHSIGSSLMPLLDLGCGRGEWLELLKEHGLQARGVDSNETMVERCRSFGLEVNAGDSLEILASLPDESVGAVTAFHMVEHMPFEVVLKLVDEIFRVLKSGGIIILETPNPANFFVGIYTFHLDPTHHKPLPGPMLRFFVEGRGFCGVHVRELHPYPEAVRFPEDGGGVVSRLNDFLYGPQDYAVIGLKP